MEGSRRTYFEVEDSLLQGTKKFSKVTSCRLLKKRFKPENTKLEVLTLMLCDSRVEYELYNLCKICQYENCTLQVFRRKR